MPSKSSKFTIMKIEKIMTDEAILEALGKRLSRRRIDMQKEVVRRMLDHMGVLAERVERLEAPEGWLSLVGLHPLPEGTSTVGTDDDCDIRLNAYDMSGVGKTALFSALLAMAAGTLGRLLQVDDPVRVGIIGAGYMGRGMVLQIQTAIQGMEVVAVSNRTISQAERAYRQADIDSITSG